MRVVQLPSLADELDRVLRPPCDPLAGPRGERQPDEATDERRRAQRTEQMRRRRARSRAR